MSLRKKDEKFRKFSASYKYIKFKLATILLITFLGLFANPKLAKGFILFDFVNLFKINPVETEVVEVKTPTKKEDADLTTEEIKALINKEFNNNPTALAISKCESGIRQFDKDGKVLSGIVNPLDKGLFQINEHYHLATSIKMGLDIHTVEGNIKYAKYLYSRNGTNDWLASKGCWGIV